MLFEEATSVITLLENEIKIAFYRFAACFGVDLMRRGATRNGILCKSRLFWFCYGFLLLLKDINEFVYRLPQIWIKSNTEN